MAQVSSLAGVTSCGASVPRAEKQICIATITAAAATVIALAYPDIAAASGEGVFNSSCAGAFVFWSRTGEFTQARWPVC